MDKFLKATYKTARRIVVALVGATVVLIGIVMIVLPGPAMIVIPAGLGILSLEFVWARRWLKKLREKAQSAVDSVRGLRNGGGTADDEQSSVPGEHPQSEPLSRARSVEREDQGG